MSICCVALILRHCGGQKSSLIPQDFVRLSSSGSALSRVPSEICAGRLRGEGETEPKQIGEGALDSTERKDSPET